MWGKEVTLTNWFQLFITGITIGCVYSLVGLGFVTIYRTSTIVNLAQGSFVMLGTFLTFSWWDEIGLPFWLSAIVGIICVVVIAMVMYWLILKRLLRVSLVAIIFATVGISILFENLVLLKYGGYPAVIPPFTGETVLRFWGANIFVQYLWVIGLMIVIFAGLHLMTSYTRTGKKMTATATNPVAARAMGISTEKMILLAFAISSAIGAIAGVSIASVVPVGYQMGGVYMLNGFTAAIVGGWGSSSGALVGGLVIGVIQSMATGIMPAGYQTAVSYGLLIIVLYLRPRGIMGAVQTEGEF